MVGVGGGFDTRPASSDRSVGATDRTRSITRESSTSHGGLGSSPCSTILSAYSLLSSTKWGKHHAVADNLVTTGQLGVGLGVTHQRVAEIIRMAEDFPEPEVTLPNGTRLWRQDVALEWFAAHPRRQYIRSGDCAAPPDVAR